MKYHGLFWHSLLGHSLVIGHWSLVILLFFVASSARAISVGTTEKDTSVAAELASFTVLDGFEVNLFASEKDGVVNPISIRWDERGRLWVLTTTSISAARSPARKSTTRS